jgi:hypothetical protein
MEQTRIGPTDRLEYRGILGNACAPVTADYRLALLVLLLRG